MTIIVDLWKNTDWNAFPPLHGFVWRPLLEKIAWLPEIPIHLLARTSLSMYQGMTSPALRMSGGRDTVSKRNYGNVIVGINVLWLICQLSLIWFHFHIGASAIYFHRGGQETRFMYHFALFYPFPACNALPGCSQSLFSAFICLVLVNLEPALKLCHLHLSALLGSFLLHFAFCLEMSVPAVLLYLDLLPLSRNW